MSKHKKSQKRNGETYAQVLQREREEKNLKAQLIIHSAEKRAIDTTLALTLIALHECEHMGAKRLNRYLQAVQDNSNEAMKIQHIDGREVALVKIEERLKKIMGDDFNTSGLLDFNPCYLYTGNKHGD